MNFIFIEKEINLHLLHENNLIFLTTYVVSPFYHTRIKKKTNFYLQNQNYTIFTSKPALLFTHFVEKEEGIPPSFVNPMKIEYTTEENKATITCRIDGKPVPQIEWYKGDEIVVPSETCQQFFDEQTGNAALVIYEPIPNEIATYTVKAVNDFGRAVGKAQLFIEADQLSAQEKPELLRSPRVTPLEAQIVKTGSTLVLKSNFTGIPEPEIKWLKNGKELTVDDDDVTISTNNNFSMVTIKNMNRKRAGKYEIVAINKAGEARSSGSVVVSNATDSDELRAPRFIQPLAPKTVLENDVVIMEATVESFPISSFQWFVNSTAIKSSVDVRIVAKENKSILIIESFQKTHTGMYMCRAENVAGSVTSTASVKIVEETQLEEVSEFISPRFIEKLKPIQLMDGEQLMLTCKVMANPTAKIQWFRNEQPLLETKGTTISQEVNGTCSLTISEVFPEDAGEYTCYASNKIGDAINKVSVSIEGIV